MKKPNVFTQGIAVLAIGLSSTVLACGLHQDASLSFVSQPGSLDVYMKVMEKRQQDVFGNRQKSQHEHITHLEHALQQAAKHPIEFVIFEAINGTSQYVSITDKVKVLNHDEMHHGHENSARKSHHHGHHHHSHKHKQHDTHSSHIQAESPAMLITELDVLDAITNKVISWHQAKAQGLVQINGSADQQAEIEALFTAI